jgi:uncharacterized protein YdeI (BOF family)
MKILQAILMLDGLAMAGLVDDELWQGRLIWPNTNIIIIGKVD